MKGAGTAVRVAIAGTGKAGDDDADRRFWGRLADVLPGSGELEPLAYQLNVVGFLL